MPHETSAFEWSEALEGVDWDEMSALYHAAPLGNKSASHLKLVFTNSRFRCFVREGGKLVGAGRALSDGADCAYICDVALLPSHQGHGLGKAIVQEPRITQHPLGGVYVAFGTGKFFETADAADLTEQGIFVIWDKNQLTPVTSGQVEKIKLEEFVNAGETFRRFKASDLSNYDWNDRGFWVPLRNDTAALDGERIVAPMILDAGVLSVTSFSPGAGTDACVPGGTSYLYRIDLAGGFTRGSFSGLSATTVGRRFAPGTTGAMPPVYELGAAGPTIHSMTAADVNTMMSSPKYRGTGSPVAQDTSNTCSNVGLRVDGTVASIPTNCVGLMPVRAWRALR